ncbi:MAG: hypothetical protein WAT42_06045 [Candidatus Nanopelagicales bacterium]
MPNIEVAAAVAVERFRVMSHSGWLIGAHGTVTAARRYPFGAVPEDQGIRDQVPTLRDPSVLSVALPGLWLVVMGIFASFFVSPWYLLGVVVGPVVAVVAVTLLGIWRCSQLAVELSEEHLFVNRSELIDGAIRIACATSIVREVADAELQLRYMHCLAELRRLDTPARRDIVELEATWQYHAVGFTWLCEQLAAAASACAQYAGIDLSQSSANDGTHLQKTIDLRANVIHLEELLTEEPVEESKHEPDGSPSSTELIAARVRAAGRAKIRLPRRIEHP